MKNNRKLLFIINKPEVYKSVNSETYLVFGEATVQDLNAAAQTSAMENLKNQEAPNLEKEQPLAEPAKQAEETAEEPVDETGVEPKDIELVMAQSAVSRARAVKALKNANNDVVNAIMSLTM